MKQTLLLSIGVSSVLLSLIIFNHNRSFKGTIVLPAGGTYLGPTDTPAPSYTGEIKGKNYPYSFTVPDEVKLVSLGGAYDIYALDVPNQKPEHNVLIGVDDISKKKKPLSDYINDWWKQFDGLKGTTSMAKFTNSKDLVGYKVKFQGGSDADIFFISPDGNYVIHLANGPLEKKVFDAIVDSVEWKK